MIVVVRDAARGNIRCKSIYYAGAFEIQPEVRKELDVFGTDQSETDRDL